MPWNWGGSISGISSDSSSSSSLEDSEGMGLNGPDPSFRGLLAPSLKGSALCAAPSSASSSSSPWVRRVGPLRTNPPSVLLPQPPPSGSRSGFQWWLLPPVGVPEGSPMGLPHLGRSRSPPPLMLTVMDSPHSRSIQWVHPLLILPGDPQEASPDQGGSEESASNPGGAPLPHLCPGLLYQPRMGVLPFDNSSSMRRLLREAM